MKKLLFLSCLMICMQIQSQKFDNLAMTPPMGWNSWNRFGLYTCAGRKTCQERPGSRGYEYQDAMGAQGFKIKDYGEID
jgi:hypothetical protein